MTKPTMERRHFELIAAIIRESRLTGDADKSNARADFMATEFSSKLRATNPAFNRDRFLKACGVSD